ncbi:MAG: BREX system ATP-binding domain-containing protein [Planctomycetota bacterium]
MAIQPGQRIGDLRIEQLLGRGAFGAVYLATDTVIQRPVALKVLTVPAEPESTERVLKEARAIGNLKSPHIVTLYRVHPPAADGAWMFEMEYIDGGPLSALLGAGVRLDPDRVATILAELASALEAAHAGGVVHGDVKPGNVLLTAEGGVKLADFGLSRLLTEASLELSGKGQLAGTPSFLAPEVVNGEHASPASDVWSMSVVAYRMLNGRHPFHATMLASLFYAIQTTDPPPCEPDVPPHLAGLILDGLAKDPAARPPVREVLARLRRPEAPAARVRAVRVEARRLLGRDAELAQLVALVERVREGQGASALISGEAGAGKTALARALLGTARRAGFRVVEAAITPLEGLLRPLLQAVREAVRGVPAPPDTKMFGSAVDLMRQLLDEEMSLRLESRSQTVWALAQLLAGITTDAPVALLIEDARHANEEDLRVLRHLVRHLQADGVLLAITCRTHEPAAEAAMHRLAGDVRLTHVRLEPLTREATHDLLRRQAGGARIDAAVSERILEVSRGNPLFAIEVLRHLEERQAVQRTDVGVERGPNWGETSLPDRFRELAAARLERLAEDDRNLLDVAAVDGVTFDGEAVAATVEASPLKVLRALQRIYRAHGLIEPCATGFRFVNAAFQEALYQDLAPELRRILHRRFAEYLEQRGGLAPERIGLHWESAGDAERAAPYLREAAVAAAHRQEFHRSIDFAERAGLRPDHPERAGLLEHAETVLAVALSYSDIGRRETAVRMLEALQNAAAEAGEEDIRLEAAVRLSRTRHSAHGAAGIDEAALRAAARREDLRICGMARFLLGQLYRDRGDLKEAERWLREAVDLLRARGQEGSLATALDLLAGVRKRQGDFNEAERLHTEAARCAKNVGHRVNAAVSEINAALVAFAQGTTEGLAEKLEQAVRTLTLEGAANLAAHATVMLANVHLAAGRLDAADEAVADALPSLERTGYLSGLVDARIIAAETALARGDRDHARRRLEEIAAAKDVDREESLRIAGIRVHLHGLCDEPAHAVQIARDAIETVRSGPDPKTSAVLAFRLAEAVVFFGLSEEIRRDIRAIVPESNEPQATLALALLDALPDDAAALRRAADALAEPRLGPRRRYLQVLGAWLAVRAAEQEGDHEAAALARRRGLDLAGAAGFAPLAERLSV